MGCTLAPPGDYDGSICVVSAVQSVSTIADVQDELNDQSTKENPIS